MLELNDMKNKISKSNEKSLNISIKKCIYKRKSTFHVSKIWHEKYNHYNKNLNGWVKGQIVLCCAKSLHLYLTLRDCMDYSPPGSSIHGILQVRILEWVANSLLQGIFLTQGSNSQLLNLLHCRWILYHWATGEAQNNLTGLILLHNL